MGIKLILCFSGVMLDLPLRLSLALHGLEPRGRKVGGKKVRLNGPMGPSGSDSRGAFLNRSAGVIKKERLCSRNIGPPVRMPRIQWYREKSGLRVE
jgi:hypothetical protein